MNSEIDARGTTMSMMSSAPARLGEPERLLARFDQPLADAGGST